jgi:hypothetical protein
MKYGVPHLTLDDAKARIMGPGETKSHAACACPKCGARVSRWVGWRIEKNDNNTYCCPCGEVFGLWGSDIWILPSSARFLENKAVIGSRWYHSTYRENWLAEITDANLSDYGVAPDWVHVGTSLSASARGKSGDAVNEYKYKHRVVLHKSVRISPLIYIDYSDWWPVEKLNKSYDVVRYINRWESVGSISLMVRPSVLMEA